MKRGGDPLVFPPMQSLSVAGVAVELWATRSVVQAPVGNRFGVVHQGRQIHRRTPTEMAIKSA